MALLLLVPIVFDQLKITVICTKISERAKNICLFCVYKTVTYDNTYIPTQQSRKNTKIIIAIFSSFAAIIC